MDIFSTIMGEIGGVLTQIKEEDMKKALDCITREARIFVDGEGRSGLMAKGFAMRLMHLGYSVFAVGETITPSLAAGDIFVAISGSGTSANVVSDAGKAKKAGCKLLVVTSKTDSPLAQLAEEVLHVPGTVRGDAGENRGSVQLLSTLFDQCLHIALDAICLMVSRRDNVANSVATKAHW